MESAARKLESSEANDLRGRVCNILKKAKVPPPNMTAPERAAVRSLKQRSDIVILTADKGSATVEMDQSEYEKKIEDLLGDRVYQKFSKDPTSSTERKITKELKNPEQGRHISKALVNKLKPTASRPPKLYGLPKIHKPDVPLRPIVSCIGSPTYQLAKHITSPITPLTGLTSSFVKNSQHFVETIGEERLLDDEAMVSFDVKSLFTSVPVDEALEVVQRRLEEDETLMERTELSPTHVTHLLELCLRTTYFKFQGSYYEQRDGAVMGSPVSPVVANIYMEMFEELALRTAEHPPRIWKRYVDDTFCVMKKTDVEGFLSHLNSLCPTIFFTMEQEDGKLPFLDTLLHHKTDGSLDISIYRKPTHTDRYLHFSSHHPRHVKQGVVSCLFHRVRTIIDNIDSVTSLYYLWYHRSR